MTNEETNGGNTVRTARETRDSVRMWNRIVWRASELTAVRLRGVRHVSGASLFDSASLGLDKYVDTRDRVRRRFDRNSRGYRDKMRDFVGDDSAAVIFTEDLKNMVHLCEAEDLDVVEKMIRTFNHQNEEIRFGNFIFGPVVMRMYHHLDRPDAAFKMFEDSKTYNFFDQLATYQILMDLLYKHGKYDEVRSVFDVVAEKQTRMIKYPKNTVVLVMAACYRQNTKRSFEYATELWSNLLSVGHNVLRKSVTLFAGLALNQFAPHVTLEALSTVTSAKYVSVFNLKVAALADMNRLEDVIPILRSVLDIDRPDVQNYNGFTEDVVHRIKESIQKTPQSKIIEKEIDFILKGLSERNLILPTTLDALLCKEIKHFEYTDRPPLHTSFQNHRSITHTQPRREGLKHMY